MILLRVEKKIAELSLQRWVVEKLLKEYINSLTAPYKFAKAWKYIITRCIPKLFLLNIVYVLAR
jgi:hypothetical protein